MTGGRVPFGGWVLSLEKFTRLEVHPGYAIAGAGVLLRDVHAAALASGQFYPPDPTETGASIGGTIAATPAGRGASAMARPARWVERLRVVLADGRDARRRARRADRFRPGHGSAARRSPRTPPAICCAPGWTGSICSSGRKARWAWSREATLRLLPAPKAVLAGLVFFPSDDAAVERGGALARHGVAAHARVLRPALARSAAHALPGDSGGSARGDPVRSGAGVGGRSGDRPVAGAAGGHRRAGGRLVVCHHGARSRALPPLPPRAAGTGQRHGAALAAR